MTGSIAAVVFLTLIACLVLTVPIGFSLGIASLGYILYTKQLTFGFIAQNMVTGCDSFPTMAIPFFIFAGELMGGGGISKRLLNLANVFFGRIQGGLAIVTVVVCMFFAAISGSGPATVAAVGGMVIPTMLEKGYDKKFVLALIAAAGYRCYHPSQYPYGYLRCNNKQLRIYTVLGRLRTRYSDWSGTDCVFLLLCKEDGLQGR